MLVIIIISLTLLFVGTALLAIGSGKKTNREIEDELQMKAMSEICKRKRTGKTGRSHNR